MKKILIKIFSYYGKFDTKEYILIGCILPIALIPVEIVGINLLKPIIGSSISIITLIGIFLIFSIALSSSIKRARAKSSHTSLIQIIVETLNIS
ncbi:hypothetical protein KJ870_09425 [bacterium]|nr:hypothetical protein [bacterium]MBU1435145.1 hypothetical protein [bacterium]MBU1502802.1 hypothetical protein [bacterium]